MKRLVALLTAVLLLTGCTDIPDSSDPQQIESIPAGNPAVVSEAPVKGASPSQIVRQFLEQNALADANHETARAFLTAAARRTWTDTTVTVLSSDESIREPGNGSVTVTGSKIGTLDVNGVYTPTLEGTGGGGSPVKYTFEITKEDGENRISRVPPGLGLLLNIDSYDKAYQSYPLYFFDQDRRYLVPDLRMSALDGQVLQTWLVRQLAAGPRAALKPAVDPDTFPATATAERGISVTAGAPLRVEISGSGQLSGPRLSRLAAQIAHTLEQPTGPALTITDDGTPVSVPGVGTQFVANQFASVERPAPASDVYYLRDGRLTTQNGRTVSGAIATGPRLVTVAVARRNGGLVVAGAGSDGTISRLYMGTPQQGVTAIAGVTGLTSRPAWAPGLAEVWVAAGHVVYRVSTDRKSETVSVPSLPAGSQVVALRLSPEGARVALVVLGTDQTKRLLVGSVVRTPGRPVEVTSLVQVSPKRVVVIDVSWLGPTRLYSIGVLADTGDPRIFEERVDGSDWSPPRGIANLPGDPDYATVVAGNLAWVSANAQVWKQDGNSWTSPGPANPTDGNAPVYLE